MMRICETLNVLKKFRILFVKSKLQIDLSQRANVSLHLNLSKFSLMIMKMRMQWNPNDGYEMIKDGPWLKYESNIDCPKVHFPTVTSLILESVAIKSWSRSKSKLTWFLGVKLVRSLHIMHIFVKELGSRAVHWISESKVTHGDGHTQKMIYDLHRIIRIVKPGQRSRRPEAELRVPE